MGHLHVTADLKADLLGRILVTTAEMLRGLLPEGGDYLQAEKDVQKVIGSMEEVSAELGRKKEVSHKVKALKADVYSHEAEAAQLTAQGQHLQRQLASLNDRLQRLEHQATPPQPRSC